MRTIGNIERFLVLGIVVVIGAILTVAITGARDLENERDSQVAVRNSNATNAANAATNKKSVKSAPKPTGLSESEAKRGESSGGRSSGRETTRGENSATRPPISPEVQKLLDARNLAGTPAPNQSPAQTPPKPEVETTATAPANPIVVDEQPLGSPPIKLDKADVLPFPGPSSTESESRTVAEPDHDLRTAREFHYEVQKGDTLERIARALYGDGLLWKEIKAANPAIGDSLTIKAGDILKLPKAPAHASPAVAARDPNAAVPAAPDATKLQAATTFKRTSTADQYQVKKGDTLMSIAAANYGTKAAWRLILDANADKIPDKDRIKTGVVLKLPSN